MVVSGGGLCWFLVAFKGLQWKRLKVHDSVVTVFTDASQYLIRFGNVAHNTVSDLSDKGAFCVAEVTDRPATEQGEVRREWGDWRQKRGRDTYKMLEFFDDDSDDEKIVSFINSITEDEVDGEASSSRFPRSRVYIARDREDAALRLYNDYFSETPMERPDATARQSLTILQKCTAAIRQMAYGTTPDFFFPIHKNREYLRKSIAEDIARLYNFHAQKHGLSGLLGSIDCMHWEWKNCPVGWQGQYTRGDQKGPSVMLEAVASQDLWIWHAFFGMEGSNNDINVLNASPISNSIKDGTSPPSPFDVNGRRNERGYYLGDGIYPDWVMLVKAPHNPIDEPRKKFKRFQESARKDIERAFGVLQGKFAMLKTPTRSKNFNKIRRHMYACIVLHNMIQENNGFAIGRREERMIQRNPPRRL
ncbi:uncharacterized protein [Rutidosis leptorrhynchoides]|uniref:uncharacterized protein n=1 Tax=Rutidosis leptorrhynchoides TaxID=125765 RepID=UPI003A994EBE